MSSNDPAELDSDGLTAPLRYTSFRRIWSASILSNLGILVQGVGAAWAMTQLTSSADKVALVQTALTLPFMLVSMPAGAIADVHDRRLIALVSLGISLIGAAALTAVAFLGTVTPNLLLVCCFVVGCGMALMVPAWQASITEHVPAAVMPAAVALNGISYNVARTVGPAIGGVVVATAGAGAAFAVNALLYLPLMRALWLWNRVVEPRKLPPERLVRALVSGARYIGNSPGITVLLLRSMVLGLIGAALMALMPLVARDLLQGAAATYGSILSAFGVGAVIGAANLTRIRKRWGDERSIGYCTAVTGGAILIVALSSKPVLTAGALMLAGAAWMMTWNVFSIVVQLSVPKWVAGRALAGYHTASTGGVAIGSWGWGHLANAVGVDAALVAAGGLMVCSATVGLWFRIPCVGVSGEDVDMLDHPVARLPLSMRSGPIVVEIEYRVAQANACAFFDAIQDIGQMRHRTGAYGWSIACDISNPELWKERFHCPTWLDYLRQRNRPTRSERAREEKLSAFHMGPGPVRIRRMLERPSESMNGDFGDSDAKDRKKDAIW